MAYAVYKPRDKPFLVRIGGPLLMISAVLTILFLVVSAGDGAHLDVGDFPLTPDSVWRTFLLGISGVQFWAGTELLVEGERGRSLTMTWVLGGSAALTLARALSGHTFTGVVGLALAGAVSSMATYLYLYRHEPVRNYFGRIRNRSALVRVRHRGA